MSSTEQPGAYVRLAKPSEYAEVTRVLTRAFAKDPAMNWYGGATKVVDDVDNPTPEDKRHMRHLSWFQEALVRATVLVNGVVTVVVVPRPDGVEIGGKNAGKSKETSNEEIVAVCMWLPPGKTLDLGLITVFRSGVLKVLKGWGMGGVKVSPMVVIFVRLMSLLIFCPISAYCSSFRLLWNAAWRSHSRRATLIDLTHGTCSRLSWIRATRGRACDASEFDRASSDSCLHRVLLNAHRGRIPPCGSQTDTLRGYNG